MKFAITVLCVGAVAFLLRVLLALVKEAVHWPNQRAREDLAVVMSDPRRSLKETKPAAPECEVATEPVKRMALVPDVRGGLASNSEAIGHQPFLRREARSAGALK